MLFGFFGLLLLAIFALILWTVEPWAVLAIPICAGGAKVARVILFERPRLLVDGRGLTIVNPFRTTLVLWDEVEDLSNVRGCLVVRTTSDRTIRCHGVANTALEQASGRGNVEDVIREIYAIDDRRCGQISVHPSDGRDAAEIASGGAGFGADSVQDGNGSEARQTMMIVALAVAAVAVASLVAMVLELPSPFVAPLALGAAVVIIRIAGLLHRD